MRPILSLNNTAWPIVRVPEFPMVLPPLGNETYFEFFQVLPIVEWYWSERSAVFWSSGGSRESNFLGGLSIFWMIISGLMVWPLSMMSHKVGLWRIWAATCFLIYIHFDAFWILFFFESIIHLVWIVFIWIVCGLCCTHEKKIWWV